MYSGPMVLFRISILKCNGMWHVKGGGETYL